MIKYILLLFISLSLTNCGGSSNSSSVTNQQTNDSNNDDSSSTPKATFTDVFAIIQSNCHQCHASPTTNGAPMSLTSYTQISFFANSILTRIKLNEGDASLMPLNGPKLSNNDINTFSDWVDEGSLNN